MFAYDIQTSYIYYKQTHAEIYGYWTFATKRTEGVQQWNKRMQRPTADFKSNTTRMQKQEEKFEYGMDWLSESFW